jgi:hypothetical protein
MLKAIFIGYYKSSEDPTIAFSMGEILILPPLPPKSHGGPSEDPTTVV